MFEVVFSFSILLHVPVFHLLSIALLLYSAFTSIRFTPSQYLTCLFHRHSIIIHVSGDNQALDEEIEYEPLYETNLSREDQNRKAVRDYLLKRAAATVYIHLFCVLILVLYIHIHYTHSIFMHSFVYVCKYICG